MNAALPVPSDTATSPGKRDVRAGLAVHTMGVYFVVKMFYLVGGGNLQPADIMLGTLAIFLTPPATFERIWTAHRLFILFIAWVLIVNIGWAAYTTNLGFLASASYYVFNLLIVCSVFATRERDKAMFDRIIIRWILASVVLQFVIVVGFRAPGRSRGTFNNPNQLSYWAVCAMSILLVLRDNKAKATDLPFQLMAIWCQIGSASRAGLGASAMLFLIWAFFALETPTKRLFGALGMAFVLILALATPLADRYIGQSNPFAVAEQRLGRSDDTSELEVRNYNRIWEYYQYTVVGAGEGQLSRFRQTMGMDLEIHSSFGTAYFSYGIIGFVLFLLFLGNIARRAGFGMAIHLAPALIYGLTHQGLRFTFFWLLIGILMSKGQSRSPAAMPGPGPAQPQVPTTARQAIRTHQPRGPEYLRAMIGPAPAPRLAGSPKEAGDPA